MSDIIKAAIITCKNNTKTTIFTALITILIAITPYLCKEYNIFMSKEHDKYIQLYSEIYFTSVKNDILLLAMQNIAEDIKYDLMTGSVEFNSEYYIKKLPVSYKILSQILNKNKMTDEFKNIPSEFIKELNLFIDKKLTHDKIMLSEVSSAKPLKLFLSSLGEMLKRYYTEIEQQSTLPSNNKMVRQELNKRFTNEFTGLVINNIEYILSDYIKTYQYIVNCENEFNDLSRDRSD